MVAGGDLSVPVDLGGAGDLATPSDLATPPDSTAARLATFAAPVLYPGGGSALAVGDLDGKNNPDIVAISGGGGVLNVLLNQGKGTFGAAKSTMLAGCLAGNQIALGDFDGKNGLDIALQCGTQPGVVLLNDGLGGFGAPRVLGGGVGDGGGGGGVVAGVFTAKGKIDLAFSTGSHKSVELLKGNGDGTFGAPQAFALPEGGAWALAGDWNGDGAPDVAVSNGGSPQAVGRARSVRSGAR